MLGSDLLRTEGKFKSKCGCINHDIFSNSVEHIILRKISLVAHRLSYKSLLEKNLINKRAKNVCLACLAVGKDCSSSNTVCITNISLENILEKVKLSQRITLTFLLIILLRTSLGNNWPNY